MSDLGGGVDSCSGRWRSSRPSWAPRSWRASRSATGLESIFRRKGTTTVRQPSVSHGWLKQDNRPRMPSPSSMSRGRGRVRLADLTATPIIALRTAPDLNQAIPLALERVVPSPHNARQQIARDQAFIELKHSIKENGLLQPILVRTDGARHVVIAGHRRLEAVRDLAVDSPD